MVAQEDPARRYTVEEWRAILDHSDIKYEYHDGWLVAMAEGTADHSRIAINAIRALEDGLGDGPCRVYNSDLAVRLSPSEYRFADAVVTRDERDSGSVTEVRAPRVAVEVLSDSTEREDRTEKFALYRACPTVEEYVLIATKYQAVEVYRRAPGDWTVHVYRLGELVELRSIAVQLALSDLYRLSQVPAPRWSGPAAPAPESQGAQTFGDREGREVG
jgi:Uma2 family endonuclease